MLDVRTFHFLCWRSYFSGKRYLRTLSRIERAVTLPPQAAQMAELYWMALTRDVPFSQYGEDEATVAAAGNTHVAKSVSSMRSLYLVLAQFPDAIQRRRMLRVGMHLTFSEAPPHLRSSITRLKQRTLGKSGRLRRQPIPCLRYKTKNMETKRDSNNIGLRSPVSQKQFSLNNMLPLS